MKRRIFLISALLILILMFILIFCTNCSNGIKYPSGKDTVHLFGDGTFQICQSGGDDDMTLFYINDGIIDNVTDIHQAEEKVYIIGTIRNYKSYPTLEYNTYASINTEENTMQFYVEQSADDDYVLQIDYIAVEAGAAVRLTAFDEFSKEDQAVFNNRELFKPAEGTPEDFRKELFSFLQYTFLFLLLILLIIWVLQELFKSFKKSKNNADIITLSPNVEDQAQS